MAFFGRGSELARLRGLLHDDPVAVIHGLPGIGKTELAYRIEAELLAAEPARQVTRVIIEPHHEHKLHVYLLARLTGRAGDDALDELVEVLVREPRLVILDDAHHAAAETAALVDRIDRRIDVASRIVVASRSVLPIVTTPIVIRLEPLDREASRALVAHLAGRLGVEIDDVDARIDHSGGSPLLLRHLVAGYGRGLGTVDPIAATITMLDAATRRSLVQLAAVSGCSQSRLAAEQLVPDGEVLRSLVEQCLVDYSPDRVVVHGLVRDAVMPHADPELVTASRRQASGVLWQEFEHRQRPLLAVEAICLAASAGDLAEALARLRSSSRTITRAGLDHLILPMLEQLADDGALEAALLAARIYLRMASVQDALRILANIPAAHAADPRVLSLRATLAERQCQVGAALAGFAQAIEHTPAGPARNWLRLRVVILHALGGRDAEVDRALGELEVELATATALDRARLWWARTIVRMLREEWREVLAAVVEGRRAANLPGGDLELDFLLRLVELIATSELGHVDKARVLVEELHAAHPSEPVRNRMTDLFIGIARLAEGKIEAAIGHLRAAHQAHAREHDVLLTSLSAQYLGRALLTEGDAVGASEVLRVATDVLVHCELTALIGSSRVLLARALISAGRLEEGQLIARALLSHHLPGVASQAHALLGYTAAFGGDVATAREHLATGLAIAGDLEPVRSNLVLDQAYVELLGGDPERAHAAALAVIDDESQRSSYACGRALVVLAATDLAAGLVDTALEALAEADALAQAHGMRQLAERIALIRNATALGESLLDRVPAAHRDGYLGMLRVLGLRSETLVVSSRRGRIHTDASHLALLARHHDLVVDRVNNTIYSRTASVAGRATAAAILAGLAESAEPVTPERLYEIVWGAREYHPLRHRNTLYIALNRTRKLLQELGELREVIQRDPGGWSIAPGIEIAIVRRDPRVSTVNSRAL